MVQGRDCWKSDQKERTNFPFRTRLCRKAVIWHVKADSHPLALLSQLRRRRKGEQHRVSWTVGNDIKIRTDQLDYRFRWRYCTKVCRWWRAWLSQPRPSMTRKQDSCGISGVNWPMAFQVVGPNWQELSQGSVRLPSVIGGPHWPLKPHLGILLVISSISYTTSSCGDGLVRIEQVEQNIKTFEATRGRRRLHS